MSIEILAEPGGGLGAWSNLTATELAVVGLVALGMTNRQAAEKLHKSIHTVNSHLRHAFVKLAVNSRVELARSYFQFEQATTGGL